jgi:RNA-directed DNA polymerase
VRPHRARSSLPARAQPALVFPSLSHQIADSDHVRTGCHRLKGNTAVGGDEGTTSRDANDLAANRPDLSARLQRRGSRPQPQRRVSIPPPGSAQGRPLGSSSFEEKRVALATKRGGAPLCESVGEDCSAGSRPGRRPHQCLDILGRPSQQKRVHHLVAADMRGLFAAVPPAWWLTVLHQRSGDHRVLRLSGRRLKAGSMADGLGQGAEAGTPPGALLSPVLAQVSRHVVLDLWGQRRGRRRCRGEADVFRLADECLAGFPYQTDAAACVEQRGERLEGCHLERAEEKTRCFDCGRSARAQA